jgi:hypothetical protein
VREARERRYKDFVIGLDRFLALAGALNAAGTFVRLACAELPAGARAVAAWYGWVEDAFMVRVFDESFPLVPEGWPVPRGGVLAVEVVVDPPPKSLHESGWHERPPML